MQSKSQLRRLRNSFRRTARNLHELGQVVHDQANLTQVRARLRRVPVWLKIARKVYHKYGLKHLLLILVFVLYQFLGACVFLFLEEKAEEDKETQWKADVLENRTKLIDVLVNSFFNNSRYLFFLTPEQSTEVYEILDDHLTNYTANYKQMTDQKIQWDFWNAMLYAGTICTTIGYGHLAARTRLGRLATMIYAIFGIPLVFTLLDDLGKWLTLGLKYPWLGCKMLIRRAFRHCTGQTLDEIRRIDQEDKKLLPVFDLPVPVAIGVVVAWIFVCSATFCIWEKNWDYFVAFYFFFVSLTTIGLGDIVPSQPKYLLMLFFYIIIGLSLVSMCVNLIQAKLERTYEAGRDEADLTDAATDIESVTTRPRRVRTPPPQTGALALALAAASRVSLGVLRTNSASTYSLSSAATRSPVRSRRQHQPTSNKICQTLLSIASPKLISDHNGDVREQRHLVPASISLDDVMKLVDTEETDLYILSQLCGDQSEANLVQTIDNNYQDAFSADDWEALLPRSDDAPRERASVQRQPSSVSSRVHFRSSISLIPSTADQLGSFTGHVASLAQMDSSSLRSPECEEPKVESGLVDWPPRRDSDYSPLTPPETRESLPSSSDWKSRILKIDQQEATRKMSFIDILKRKLTLPIQTSIWKIRKPDTAPRKQGTTSIEVQRQSDSDDDDEDGDRTPLEPKRQRHL